MRIFIGVVLAFLPICEKHCAKGGEKCGEKCGEKGGENSGENVCENFLFDFHYLNISTAKSTQVFTYSVCLACPKWARIA